MWGLRQIWLHICIWSTMRVRGSRDRQVAALELVCWRHIGRFRNYVLWQAVQTRREPFVFNLRADGPVREGAASVKLFINRVNLLIIKRMQCRLDAEMKPGERRKENAHSDVKERK